MFKWLEYAERLAAFIAALSALVEKWRVEEGPWDEKDEDASSKLLSQAQAVHAALREESSSDESGNNENLRL